MKIAVAGTGYVGLSMATLLAQHHRVMAMDVIAEKYYIEVIMQEKIRLYLEYVQNASFWYDIKLFFLTFWTIVKE